MSDSNNITAIMLNKLQQHRDYLAWYFSQYKKNENLADEQIADILGSSIINVNRLAMCKVPDSKFPDFTQRVKNLGELTSTNRSKIIMIIRKVNSITTLQNNSSSIDLLLAARENDNKPNEDKS